VVGFQVDEVHKHHKVPVCALFPLGALTWWRSLVALELGALDSLGLVGACFPRFVHFVRLHQICVPSALSSNFSTWNPTTPRGCVPTKKEGGGAGGGRRLPGAWAGPEVDGVSKNVLEDLERIDKAPQNECKPGTRKRGAKARSVAGGGGGPGATRLCFL
jgi:hypothetical protein